MSHQEPASAYEPQVGHQSPSNSVSAVDHQQQRPATPVSPIGRGVGLETGFGVGAKMGRGVGAGTGDSDSDEHHAIPQFSQFAWPVPQ